ncbi:MAG: YbaB/EbfC family nucleoid-associated protein [Spirochaetales bacterium]|nr:YbaB/EbfC family nucleoid-associated protein [Spirochaetales bacterium]
MNLIEMLKSFQGELGNIPGRLKTLVVEGSSGAGMVTLSLNGQMEVLQLTIAPEIINPQEAVVLQDLVVAAFNDALRKIREATMGSLGNLYPGIKFPPGSFGTENP